MTITARPTLGIAAKVLNLPREAINANPRVIVDSCSVWNGASRIGSREMHA
jgi:hypothetical protein